MIPNRIYAGRRTRARWRRLAGAATGLRRLLCVVHDQGVPGALANDAARRQAIPLLESLDGRLDHGAERAVDAEGREPVLVDELDLHGRDGSPALALPQGNDQGLPGLRPSLPAGRDAVARLEGLDRGLGLGAELASTVSSTWRWMSIIWIALTRRPLSPL